MYAVNDEQKPESPDTSRVVAIDSELATLPLIVREFEAIAGEMRLEQLLANVVDLMVRHSGARDACLILQQQDRWFVHARRTGETPAAVVRAQSIDECDFLSPAIVGEVVRTRQPIVLSEPASGGIFVQDPYVLRTKVNSVLCLPLLHHDHLSAVVYLENKMTRGIFTPRRIATLEALSTAAAIALENARCRQELAGKQRELENRLDVQIRALRAKNDELEAAHERLKQMQAQIVAQEKMAMLGAITSGIAHEIKNPLNFVVNFAALSIELVNEIREELAHSHGNATSASRDNVDELLRTLADNCAKVNQHGLRADGIVRTMQMHARGQAGQPEPTDINRLLDENLALAFHGARSSDREFNATMERQLEPNLPKISVVPQEIGRVFLNLFSNGFYAARAAAASGRNPTLRVATRDMGDTIQIRIADNGMGIPEDVRKRIFEPFFTTKPIGEGTGLGLSISHDIIVRDHHGTMRFESVTGEGTEFILELPKTKAAG